MRKNDGNTRIDSQSERILSSSIFEKKSHDIFMSKLLENDFERRL